MHHNLQFIVGIQCNACFSANDVKDLGQFPIQSAQILTACG